MELIIDRDKWARGEYVNSKGAASTRLLDSDGKMCCLGFYALVCGFKENEIENEGEPGDVPSDKWPESCLFSEGGNDDGGLSWSQTFWTREAIAINDNPVLDEDEREQELKEHFAKVDVELEFTGGAS